MSTEAVGSAGAQGLLSASSASPAVDALLVSSTGGAPDPRARPERARAALLSLQLRTAEHEAAAAEHAEQAWSDGGAHELLKARLDSVVQHRRDELAAELERARADAARAGIPRAEEVPLAAEVREIESLPVAETSGSLPAVDVDLLARAIAREIVAALPDAARGEGRPRARARADRPDRTRADRARDEGRRSPREGVDDSAEVASRPRRAPRPRADRARADRARGTEERASRARANSRPAAAPTRPKRAARTRVDGGEPDVEQPQAPAQPPAQVLPARVPFLGQLLHLDVALPLLAVLVVVMVLLAWVS